MPSIVCHASVSAELGPFVYRVYREKFAVTRNTGTGDDGHDTVSFEELVRLDYDAGLSGSGLRCDATGTLS